jgi:hypothetical protein
MRNMKALRLVDVDGNVIFISEQAAAAQGRKKRRRKSVACPRAPTYRCSCDIMARTSGAKAL